VRDIDRFFQDLAVNKRLQGEALALDPEAEAFTLFARIHGYQVSLDDVESVLKDLLWLARVGDDIDHA
jgi:hypothetical protein